MGRCPVQLNTKKINYCQALCTKCPTDKNFFRIKVFNIYIYFSNWVFMIRGQLDISSEVVLTYNLWFQKISIPPPQKGLEFLGGWRGQRPRKILRGWGVLYQFILFFPDRFHYSYNVKFSLFAFCLLIRGCKHCSC